MEIKYKLLLIVDTFGSKVKSNLNIESENKAKISLNIEDSPPGIYALKLKNTKSKQSIYLVLITQISNRAFARLDIWILLSFSKRFSGRIEKL